MLMINRKVKIIPRESSPNGVLESWETFESKINEFLTTLESHHIKGIAVKTQCAVIEYV